MTPRSRPPGLWPSPTPIDPRASLTIGPLTIFEDGEIKVRKHTPPREIASQVLAAVEEAKGWAHAKGASEAAERARAVVQSERGLLLAALEQARVEERAKVEAAIRQIEREAAEAHDDAWSKGALRAVDVLRSEPVSEPVSCKNTEH